MQLRSGGKVALRVARRAAKPVGRVCRPKSGVRSSGEPSSPDGVAGENSPARQGWLSCCVLPCPNQPVQVSLVKEELPQFPSIRQRYPDPREHTRCL
jgi:hypothetical protein